MRTTIDLPDDLFRRAKQLAAEEGRSLREVIIDAVQARLSSSVRTKGYVMPDCSVGRGWVVPEFASADWQTLQKLSYEPEGED
jgi:hypothetical protein